MPFIINAVPGGFKVVTEHSGYEHSRVPLSWENANTQMRALEAKYGTMRGGQKYKQAMEDRVWDWDKNKRYTKKADGTPRYKEPYHKDLELLRSLTPGYNKVSKGYTDGPDLGTVSTHLKEFIDNEKGTKDAKPSKDWGPDRFTKDLVYDMLSNRFFDYTGKKPGEGYDFVTAKWLYDNASVSKPLVQYFINKWLDKNAWRTWRMRTQLENAGFRKIPQTPEEIASIEDSLEDYDVDPDATDMEGEGRPRRYGSGRYSIPFRRAGETDSELGSRFAEILTNMSFIGDAPPTTYKNMIEAATAARDSFSDPGVKQAMQNVLNLSTADRSRLFRENRQADPPGVPEEMRGLSRRMGEQYARDQANDTRERGYRGIMENIVGDLPGDFPRGYFSGNEPGTFPPRFFKGSGIRKRRRMEGGKDTRAFPRANELHFTPAVAPEVPLQVLPVPPPLRGRLLESMDPAEARAYLLNRQRILVQNRLRFPYGEDGQPMVDIHPENLASARTGMGRKRARY